jgi:hypothetical protein
VRSITASSSCSDVLPPVFSCRAGTRVSHDALGEHLPVIQPLDARDRSRHVRKIAKAVVGLGTVPILARWLGNSKKFIFYFLLGFKLNLNFKKLYLNIQSSKNY